MKKIFIFVVTAICLSLILLPMCAFSLAAEGTTEVVKILGFDTNDYKDGKLKDSTGYGIELTKVGDGSIEVVEGKNGKALHFNGAGLGINELQLNLGKTYTICTTVRFPEQNTSNVRIFGSGIFDMGAGFTMITTSDGNQLFAGAANDDEQFIGFVDGAFSQNVDDIYDGKWHTIALVVDLEKGYQRVYIDGGIEAVNTWSNPNMTRTDEGTYVLSDAKYNSVSNQAFGLACGGVNVDSYTDFGKISIQDFAIYNKAFTINEFRWLLGLDSVEGGDINDPVAPTIVDLDTSNLPTSVPNNYNKNSVHNAIFGMTLQKEAIVESSNSIYYAAGALALSTVLLVVSFILFKRGMKNAVKNS